MTDISNSHNLAHELFHNLIHAHINAPMALRTMINTSGNQEPGHKKAGGIFIYQNDETGSKTEDINQGNIQDVLTSVPEFKSKSESKPSLVSGQSIFGGVH